MNGNIRRRLVAISGVTGSGKTTLANNLATELSDSAVFRFEHYQAAENEARGSSFVLHDHDAWNAVGYDPNRILGEPPGFGDLLKLLNGEAVHPPGVREAILPGSNIILEDAFARDLDILKDLIEVSIHISVPLDVALCRALVRFERNGSDPMPWVHNYLNYSLHYFYARLERVRESADLVIDGTKTPEDVLGEALAFLESGQGKQKR